MTQFRVRRHRPCQTVCWTAILSYLLAGCATLQVPEPPVKPAAQYRATAASGGLTVAVAAIVDPRESEELFGTDLASRGILPVLVVAENQGSSSFVLARDQISLKELPPVPDESLLPSAREINNLTGCLLVASVLVCLPVAIAVPPVGSKLESDASVVTHTYRLREFRTQTVSPGKSASGFVYVRLPPETRAVPGRLTAEVAAFDVKKKERIVVQIPFTPGGRS